MQRFTLASLFLILAGITMLLSQTARADTYQFAALETTNNHYLYGIDSSADVVLWSYGDPDPRFGICPEDRCYVTYSGTGAVVGGPVGSPPALNYDSGQSCTFTAPANFFIGPSRCNNGFMAFGGTYDNSALANQICTGSETGGLAIFCRNHGLIIGLFTGLDPFADYLAGPNGGIDPADNLVINSNGDFGVVDGRSEEIYVVTRVSPTPEPSTFVLLGIATIPLGWMLGRRRFAWCLEARCS